ncbi:MAG: hypothetical protein K2H01_09385 [Ruminococcus sp.]|nr:hypothetical protein [Ruminococcus sp.]
MKAYRVIDRSDIYAEKSFDKFKDALAYYMAILSTELGKSSECGIETFYRQLHLQRWSNDFELFLTIA